MRKINGIAAHLHGVLRGADHGGANPHVGGTQRNIAAAELIDAGTDLLAKLNTEIAQIALLVTVNELRYAAGEHHRVDRVGKIKVGSEQEILHFGREFLTFENLEQRVAQHLSELVFFVLGDGAAHSEIRNAGDLGDLERGVFEAVDLAILIHGDEPRADFHGAGIDYLAALDDGDLASAAADVDVHHGEVAALVIGHVHRARPV